MTDPTKTTTDPLDAAGPRTLAWYMCHGFYEDGRLYSYDIKQGFANAPSVATNLQVLREAGLHDIMLTVEALRPLLADQVAWWATVDKSWEAYKAEENKLRVTLSWILSTVLKDPSLPADVPIITTDDLYAAIAYQPLTLAAAMGRLRFVTAAELDTANVSYQDILVLDQGHLVQQGRHLDLIDAGGLYAELYRTLVRAEV